MPASRQDGGSIKGLRPEQALREREEARQVKETGEKIKAANVERESRFKTSLALLVVFFLLIM